MDNEQLEAAVGYEQVAGLAVSVAALAADLKAYLWPEAFARMPFDACALRWVEELPTVDHFPPRLR